MTEIRIDNAVKLKGTVFRVAEMTDGACRRSLYCRIVWKNDDYQVCFYDSMRGADHDWKPLEALRGEQVELAAKAIEHALAWINSPERT